MLIAFDFDGTLSDSEMMVLLGERHGVADEIAEITERAMNDEISYAESLHERADLKQYGDLELDRSTQNKALVIDFAGVQGKKCPVNKFTTGGS